MKVVHILGGDLNSGAHLGAFWLHEGLQQIGVDSSILGVIPPNQQTNEIISTSATAAGKVKDFIVRMVDPMLVRAYRRRRGWNFSSGLSGRKVTGHRLIRQADVVNIHWISQGPLSIRGIGTVARVKPTVWTLRDMWPFTGGCHYSMGCTRYTQACGACPQLGSKRTRDLSRLVLANKKRALPPTIHVVGISEWLTACAQRSALFQNFNVTTIPNCIDTANFWPVDKREARVALGLPEEKQIVLLGAESVHHFYKGFDAFVSASKLLDGSKLLVLMFGKSDPELLSKIALPVRDLGYLRGSAALRLAYSAADAFVAPSREEAFGKTIVEAMACGTPVVCFDATGPKDIVEHGRTGYKARPFDIADLAHGIEWALTHAAKGELKEACFRRARERFDKKAVAELYLELYRGMIANRER